MEQQQPEVDRFSLFFEKTRIIIIIILCGILFEKKIIMRPMN